MKNRTIFIGDIHGCYDELKLLLSKLELQEEDRVFFVGDLINKGPKSYKVIKLLYKNREQFKVVLGNHDLEFLKYINGKECNFFRNNRKFRKLKRKLEKKLEILNYFKNIPLYIEEKDFLLIHAGLIPNKLVDKHIAQEICYLRTYKGKPWYEYYIGKKKIIYGHWAEKGLNIKENTIGLDTGCCYGNYLTAYILETGKIITQNALKQYVDPFENKSIIGKVKNHLKNIYENKFIKK